MPWQQYDQHVYQNVEIGRRQRLEFQQVIRCVKLSADPGYSNIYYGQ
jgi:hypothetical protein